jgi:CHAD domain-containing protein
VTHLTSDSEVTTDSENVGTFLRNLLLAASNEIDAAAAEVRDSHREGVPYDPESIRRLRLAFRRLLYRVEMMADVEESLSSKDLVQGLDEVGKPLGELRDAEILETLVIDALGDRIGSPEGRQLMSMVTELLRAKQLSADTMINSPMYQDVLRTTTTYRESIPTLAASTLSIRPFAHRVMYVSWRRLRKAAKKAKRNASDDNLHQLRIAAKRSMYSAQTFEALLGTPTKRFASRLAMLQRHLGGQHDHVVACAWIGQVGADHPSLRRLTKALSAKERKRADRSAKKWTGRWKAVRKARPGDVL